MIPAFDVGGVLPTFHSENPTAPDKRSPYRADLFQVIERFATSRERAELLIGLVNYRRKLFSGGFNAGWQWIDGSFVEDVEKLRSRSPKDIDVVTHFYRPIRYQASPDRWAEDYRSFIHDDFFNTRKLKPIFRCDCYGVDLDADRRSLVQHSNYWMSLFSEQRDTLRKKGLVEIPLMSDAMEANKAEQMIKSKFNV